jgi:5-methylcytosine-specific restriction enzyme subunit McrC
MRKRRTITLVEGESLRVARGEGEPSGRELTRAEFERLQRWDERGARGKRGAQVFKWESRAARTNGYVGVIQWRELVIEILPKVAAEEEAQSQFAQGNLLVMLEYAMKLRHLHRGRAAQSLQRGEVAEHMIALFARGLREELFRGREQRYQEVSEALGVLRGRLMVREQVCRGQGRLDRLHVRYEEYLPDTALNRAFKATCRALVRVSRVGQTRELLGECAAMLDEVRDVAPEQLVWEEIRIDRLNERFSWLLELARQLMEEQRSSGRAGEQETFALLYPMDALYERFVAEFLRREVLRGVEGYTLRTQGGSPRRHVLTEGGRATAQLKPDLLVTGPHGLVVLDTKWKHLSRSEARQGVSMQDVYQLLVYGHVFESGRVVLLYPSPVGEGMGEVAYESEVTYGAGGERVMLERAFIPLGADLREEAARDELVVRLCGVIAGGGVTLAAAASGE